MVFGLKFGRANKGQEAPPPRSEQPPPGSDPAPARGGAGNSKSALTVNEFVARTKRGREKGLEPTKPELIAYARYLGIDPFVDGDLMWIVDEALKAPLPSEWTEHHDNGDRVFYFNVLTTESSWTHPLEQLHRDTYKGIVNFRAGNLSKQEQAVELEKMRLKCEEAEREAHKELQAWTEHVDQHSAKFYHNHEQQRSTWTDPRPARCHALYLQMQALRVLSKHCGQSCSTRGPEPLFSEVKRPGKEVDLANVQRPKGQQSPGVGAARGLMGLDESSNNNTDRRSRKKRRDKDLEKSARDHLPEDLCDDLLELKKPALDLIRPTSSAVREVREALVGGSSRQPMAGPMPGMAMPLRRMPSPPGDGRQNQGRAKVRAGIRLEPLNVS